MKHEEREGFPPPYYDYPFGSKTTAHRVLTVKDAVQLALENAAAYRQAQFDELVAGEDVKQSRTAFLPQFTLPLTYNGTTNSQVRNPGDPLIFAFVSSSAINETIAFLNASGPIDLSGRLRAALRHSRAMLAAAHAGTQAARRSLAISTVDAYYGLVLARQKRRLADETLALAEAFAKIAEDALKRGEGDEADAERARGSALLRRDELEQARAAESAAMDVLRALTGIEFSTHIALSNIVDAVPSAEDFSNYTEELIKTRPELSQFDALKRAALADKSAAMRELLPQLSYSLNGGFDAADFRPVGRFSGAQAIISLNVPVFNWGASRSRATQARLRAESLDLQRVNTLRQLQAEFYTARANALSALERINYTRAAADALERNITLVFSRYRAKKATILDVIDAQSSYASARLAYYQAIGDYRTARVRLEADPTQMFRAENIRPAMPPSMPSMKCGLNLAQAPDVGGLRLGMTVAQAQALFPSLNVSKPSDTDVQSAVLKAGELNSRPESRSYFEGAETLALEFTDGRLSFIRVNYPATNRWGSSDEFVSETAQKLNIQGTWKRFYDWENKSVRDIKDLRDQA
ncbi:MAG: TolC family protein, partial [Acidobacteriota bacterium]|nr:TolC family protein [Acidobacteriota bacterium]